MTTPGHTVGHHSFVIESEGRQLINTGDVLHHPVLLLRHPEWHNVFDSDREMGAATRRRVLDHLARTGTQAINYHFPFPGSGTIRRDGDRFTWLPASLHEG
jgi:glyoxylase-like metal-dependent hydrolase (beta-lactamase superfamily II)